MDNKNKENHIEKWYKINKCSNEANSFILCINQRKNKHDKCKNLFDSWFKCINQNIK